MMGMTHMTNDRYDGMMGILKTFHEDPFLPIFFPTFLGDWGKILKNIETFKNYPSSVIPVFLHKNPRKIL